MMMNEVGMVVLMGVELGRVFRFDAPEEKADVLKGAVEVLPLKKMGLEQGYPNMSYRCELGTFDSVVIRPVDDVLHSIWIPKGATNVHSTEEYQGFRFRGKDYFIYRRPKNHIRKFIAC